MRDATSVITTATDGIVKDLAKEYEVSLGRMYELLSTDNPLPKTKKLIRKIGHVDTSPDKWRVRLCKADIDAMFCEILGETESGEVDAACMHSELSEAIQAKLSGLSRADRLKECREAKAILDMEINHLEKDEIRRSNGFEIKAPQEVSRFN